MGKLTLTHSVKHLETDWLMATRFPRHSEKHLDLVRQMGKLTLMHLARRKG